MDKRNIVIIGAGPAGLTAAYTLLKSGGNFNVTILEADNVIGGISRTLKYKGNRIDIGGHRFFSKDKRIMRMWQEIMPLQGKPSKDELKLGVSKAFPESASADPESEDNVFLIRRRVSRIYFLRRFFDYPISLKPQTFINMGFANTIRSGFGYIKSCVHNLPETSLENFYINRFGKPLYSMFFEAYTEKLWGVHPSQIAADWGAQRVKGLSVSKLITSALSKIFKASQDNVETSLIEEFYYPKYGPGQLWERLADTDASLGADIRMNTQAVRINTDGIKIRSVTARGENGEYDIPCDYVISSMPIKELAAAIPDTPENVRAISDNLPYRDFITVGLLADKLEIENKTKIPTINNIVPDCWIYIQERNVKIGRLQIFNNWSPYMVDDMNKHIWIGLEYFCSEGDELWSMSESEFTAFAVEELEKIGIIKKESIRDSFIAKIKKAYPAYFGTYSQFDTVRGYLDTFENLYCVGRNGQHRYNNMDHSMLTAIKAAEDIISGKGDKASVWNVNTEKEYHETVENKQ